MTMKRFIFEQNGNFHTVRDTVENKPMGVFEFKENEFPVYACFHMIIDKMNELHEENQSLKKKLEFFYELNKPYGTIIEENKQLKAQLYCDDEEGVCNICKHHYLVKDDEAELGYYNSRCRKGHYECARVSLKYCEDFEKELKG